MRTIAVRRVPRQFVKINILSFSWLVCAKTAEVSTSDSIVLHTFQMFRFCFIVGISPIGASALAIFADDYGLDCSSSVFDAGRVVLS